MEAIFAGSIDLTYVGPNPAINAFARRGGADRLWRRERRVGAGGAGQCRPAHAGRLSGQEDRDPPVGQHAGCLGAGVAHQGRAGDRTHRRRRAGDPTENPDQLSLFQSGQLDAVWTVEPWVSRLEAAGGTVLVDERDSVTTVLVSSAAFLAAQRETARRFVAAHVELTV